MTVKTFSLGDRFVDGEKEQGVGLSRFGRQVSATRRRLLPL